MYAETPSIKSLKKDRNKYYALVNSEKLTVPNVKGMAGMDAIAVLENLGLKVKFQGTGKVTQQSIEKGEALKKGMTIVLKLS